MSSAVMSRYLGSRRLGDPSLHGDSAGSWVPDDPFVDWENEARSAADFAWNLVDTDAHSSALLMAIVRLTLGSEGLRFRSKYQNDQDPSSTTAETFMQRLINREIEKASAGFNLDAGCQLTRHQMETLAVISKAVTGDGFGVRVWNPRRPDAKTGSSWRMIGSDRVCNPYGICNWQHPEIQANDQNGQQRIVAPEGHVIWEGIELDANHKPFALWYKAVGQSRFTHHQIWSRVEYRGPGGVENVIHRFDPLRAGQMRGFSDFASVYVTAKQLKGTAEAHMIGKRAQACHPIWISSSDEKLAAAFARNNAVWGANSRIKPGMVSYLGTDGAVHSPNWSYNGDDFKQHVETMVRAMSAARGIPWQYVLMHIEGVSMASGRIFIDQAQQTGTAMQNAHIAQVTHIIDKVILRESITRRRIPVTGLQAACEGRYLRPRVADTDRNKSADAALKWWSMGLSPTTIYAESGRDFEEEMRQRKQDMAFLSELGLEVSPHLAPEPKAADDDTKGGNDEDAA